MGLLPESFIYNHNESPIRGSSRKNEIDDGRGLTVPIRMNTISRTRPILGMLPAHIENATYNIEQAKVKVEQTLKAI